MDEVLQCRKHYRGILYTTLSFDAKTGQWIVLNVSYLALGLRSTAEQLDGSVSELQTDD